MGFLVGLVVAALFVTEAQSAHAATTRQWTGAVNLNWNTPGNWSPAGVPANGDSVVIGGNAYARTLVNDVPGELLLDTLTMSNAVRLEGNRLGISRRIDYLGDDGNFSLRLPIVIRGDDVTISLPTLVTLFLGNPGPDAAPNALIASDGTRVTVSGGELTLGLGVPAGIVGRGQIILDDADGNFFHTFPSFAGKILVKSGSKAWIGPSSGGGCSSAANTAFVLAGGEMLVSCPVAARSLEGIGKVDLSFEGRLILGGAGFSAFDGEFVGGASTGLICCGSGVQVTSGASPNFRGNVLVSGGKFVLDGATVAPASSFTVQGPPGAVFPILPTLAGFGQFGDTILTDATLDFRANDDYSSFGLARFPNLQFAPSVNVRYRITGPIAGSGFSQIVLTGQLVLDNAKLDLDFADYTPPVGQSFTLVTGASALLDTFAFPALADPQLSEGEVFDVGALKFKITYQGGASGHDVIITRQAAAGATPTATATATPTTTPSPSPLKFRRFLPFVVKEN